MANIIPSLPSIEAGNRARDAAGVLRDLELLMSGVTPDWTDRSHADPGVALAQLSAYLLDHVFYQVGRGLTDSTFALTTRRSAAVALADALGYPVDGASAAVGVLRFTLQAVQGFDVTIPAGTQVSGVHQGRSVTFSTDVEAVISSGSTTADVSASHGAKAEQALGASSGVAYQHVAVSSTAIVKNRTQNSLVVSVGGITWTEVTSFAQSVATDKHFVVRRDYLDKLTLMFGDGYAGAIPGAGLQIVAKYREGGGPDGNVPPATLTTIDNPLAVAASVTNQASAQGGSLRQSLASIRARAPGYFATQQRVVTSNDYDATASAVSGVLRAAAYRTALNHVRVRVVPQSWLGATANPAVLAAVQVALDAKRMVTDIVSVATAIPVRPNMSLVVTATAGSSRAVVSRDVREAIATLYAQSKLGFGADNARRGVFVSDVVAVIDGTTGVDHVDVKMFTRVPLLIGLGPGGWDVASALATLGTVAVSASATDETWRIVFLGATTFSVEGTVSGMQASTGTVGQVYTSNNGAVSFTITAPLIGVMSAGNAGRFRTSRILDNIPVGPEEHPVYLADLDLDLVVVGGVA